MEEQNNNGQLQIELREEVAQGTYANLAIITHSSSEFILDFVRVMPGIPKAGVQSRIIVAPEHAKRLLRGGEPVVAALHGDAVVIVVRTHYAQHASFPDDAFEGVDVYVLHFARRHLRDRKSTRLNSSHIQKSRMPSSA